MDAYVEGAWFLTGLRVDRRTETDAHDGPPAGWPPLSAWHRGEAADDGDRHNRHSLTDREVRRTRAEPPRPAVRRPRAFGKDKDVPSLVEQSLQRARVHACAPFD